MCCICSGCATQRLILSITQDFSLTKKTGFDLWCSSWSKRWKLAREWLLLNRQLRAQGMDEIAVAHVDVGRLVFDSGLYYCSCYKEWYLGTATLSSIVMGQKMLMVKYNFLYRSGIPGLLYFEYHILSHVNSIFKWHTMLLTVYLCLRLYQSLQEISPVSMWSYLFESVLTHINNSIGNCRYVVTFPIFSLILDWILSIWCTTNYYWY